MIDLRPYQAKGAGEIRVSFRDGARRVIYSLPTGGGKTYTFSYIAQAAAAKGTTTGILVHRQELLLQASASLASMGIRHGLIASGPSVNEVLSANARLFGDPMIDQRSSVTVGSIQTLVRRLDDPARFKLLILDEAHHATAGTWETVAAHYAAAKILGVTATPCRMTGKGLGEFFDDMVEGPTIAELIAGGYLTDALVYAPPMAADLSGLRSARGDYVTKEVAERMDKSTVTGDAVKHYSKYANGVPALAFCVSVAHAEHVADTFRAAGYRAASVDGKMNRSDRAALIRDLGEGRIDVLTSCDLISEGTDVPRVGAAILLRPTKSEGLFLQQVGRVLRPYPGKDRAIILDHAGNCLKHGHPTEVREWSLGEGVVKKKQDGEGGEALRTCPECYAIFPTAPVCPECDHEFKIAERQPEHVDGELVVFDEATLKRQREIKAKKAARRRRGYEESQCESLDALKALGESRGYKTGWALKAWDRREAKQGVAQW